MLALRMFNLLLYEKRMRRIEYIAYFWFPFIIFSLDVCFLLNIVNVLARVLEIQ
jgi:hypothetical protein